MNWKVKQFDDVGNIIFESDIVGTQAEAEHQIISLGENSLLFRINKNGKEEYVTGWSELV